MPPPAGQFLAMSVFFYGMHCLHYLGPTKLTWWPSPSLAELRAASKAFCAMDWSMMMHEDEAAVSVHVHMDKFRAPEAVSELQMNLSVNVECDSRCGQNYANSL